MTLTRESAETIALEALEWLVGNDDLLPVFMGATGAGAEDLKAGARNPEFLASVLDFILMDDAWVMGVCDAQRIPYERLMQVRAALPGGEAVHWT